MKKNNQDMETPMKYFSLEERLGSFQKFPTIKGAPLCKPMVIAEAGFYSIATKAMPDLVKCFACDKELGSWEAGDDPWEEHKRRGQECPFVLYNQNETPTLRDFNQLLFSVLRRRLIQISDESLDNLKYAFEKQLQQIKEVV